MRRLIVLLLLFFPTFSHAATCVETIAQGTTNTCSAITKDSITWTLNGDYEVGQYVSGDFFVVWESGLQISSISPTPTTTYGTVVNPQVQTEPYTSSAPGYESGYQSTPPISLTAGDKVVSTTPFAYNSTDKSYIDEAAILVVVSSAPASGSFRPGLTGSPNTVYNINDVSLDIFADLTVQGSAPSAAAAADNFARPWLDHTSDWTFRQSAPMNNMCDDYWGDAGGNTRCLAEAVLRLNTNISAAEKIEILKGYLQYAIDTFAILEHNGSLWGPDGARKGGRKMPILLLGLTLNDSEILGYIANDGDTTFQEDGQTFYVTQDDVDCTHNIGCDWLPDDRSHTPAPYTTAMIGMPEWAIRHSTYPERSDASFEANYRALNHPEWGGVVLSVLIMGIEDYWNHDAIIDYYDRMWSISHGGDSWVVPDEYSMFLSTTNWEGAMWDVYRDNAPYVSATTNPTITITSPTTSSTYGIYETPITTLSGTTSDDGTVSSVTWTCPTCTPTSGTTGGTVSAWTIASVGLAVGVNVVTVTATDNESNIGTDTITLTYALPANGSCGDESAVVNSCPSTNLCADGTASVVTQNADTCTWSCYPIPSGTTATCSASLTFSGVSVFEWSASSYTMSEDGGPVDLTINRTQYTDGVATVEWGTSHQSATDEVDYVGVPYTTISFADGEASKTVSVTPIEDDAGEGTEYLDVYLQNPTNGTLGTLNIVPLYITDGTNGSPTGTITAYSLLDGSVIPYKLTTE